MPDYVIAPAARLDLLDIWDYFANEIGNPDLADRFSVHVRLTFAKLAGTSGLGRSWPSQLPELAGLQQWRVGGLPKVLVFYRKRADVLEIARVIHGARDLESALSGQQPPTTED